MIENVFAITKTELILIELNDFIIIRTVKHYGECRFCNFLYVFIDLWCLIYLYFIPNFKDKRDRECWAASVRDFLFILHL